MPLPNAPIPEKHPSIQAIGARVRKLRRERELSIEYVADTVEVDDRTIMRIEQGRQVNLSSLIPVLEFFGLELTVKP